MYSDQLLFLLCAAPLIQSVLEALFASRSDPRLARSTRCTLAPIVAATSRHLVRASAPCSLLLHIKDILHFVSVRQPLCTYAHLAYNFKSTSHEEVASQYILCIVVHMWR